MIKMSSHKTFILVVVGTPLFLYLFLIYKMSKVWKALAVSFGALAGGAGGFYVLEMYKIKSKVISTKFFFKKKY